MCDVHQSPLSRLDVSGCMRRMPSRRITESEKKNQLAIPNKLMPQLSAHQSESLELNNELWNKWTLTVVQTAQACPLPSESQLGRGRVTADIQISYKHNSSLEILKDSKYSNLTGSWPVWPSIWLCLERRREHRSFIGQYRTYKHRTLRNSTVTTTAAIVIRQWHATQRQCFLDKLDRKSVV